MQNGPLKNVAGVSAPATKTDTPLLETSQAVSAVTRDQIEQQTASSIKQALLYTSGVAVDTRGAYSDFDVILARHQENLSRPSSGIRLMASSASRCCTGRRRCWNDKWRGKCHALASIVW